MRIPLPFNYYTGKKVRIYRNLQENCWSVKHRGKVVGHVDRIALEQVKFVVNKSGRKRCLEEKQKNVHAFAEGLLLGVSSPLGMTDATKVSYNPYKYNFFFNEREEKVSVAELAVANENGLFIKGETK